jgi:hypothetical protein
MAGTKNENVLNHDITDLSKMLPVRTFETFVPQVEVQRLVCVVSVGDRDDFSRLAVARWVLTVRVLTACQAVGLDFHKWGFEVVVAVVVVVLGNELGGAPDEIQEKPVVELCRSRRIRNLGRDAEGEDGERGRIDRRALPVVKRALEVHGLLEVRLVVREIM